MLAKRPPNSSPSIDAGMTSTNKKKKRKSMLFYCGFASGMVQAALFNPWDRALYLTIKENRKFLHLENFRRPFTGLMQTLFQRTVSAGLYFPLEDIFMQYLLNLKERGNLEIHRHWIALIAGNLAGAASGLILNPLAAVKYHTWGVCESKQENFLWTSLKLYRHGGIKPFITGTFATVSRDMAFGGCFSLIRHGLHSTVGDSEEEKLHNQNFVIDMVAAICGTVVSSPLNYVRNIHYATPPGRRKRPTYDIFSDLWKNTISHNGMFNRVRYIHHQLRLGWGTLRVGCGMAMGSKIYGTMVTLLAPDEE